MIIKNQAINSKRIAVRRGVSKLFKILLIAGLLTAIVLFLVSQTTIFNPKISVYPDASFFSDSIEIELSSLGAGRQTQIRYTLDGSNPSPDSDPYQHPITISETTTIKAAIFRDETQVSQILTHDFFINTNHQLPVVSLVTDPINLWDPEIGIYVEGNHENYTQRGSDWQRPATFTYYEPDSLKASYTKDIGIRIHGGGSRELPQKTLRLYADPNDTGDLFNYPFFEDYHTTYFDTLILRNSGNDWGRAFIRDILISKIASNNTHLDYMVGRPVVVYLNGDYWGIHYLRDRFDKEYLHQLYKIDPLQISLLEVTLSSGTESSDASPKSDDAKDDAKLYNNLLSQAADCVTCVDYNFYNQYLDMQNLIDYFIFELHFINMDWPNNNTNIWRYNNTLVAKDISLSKQLEPGQNGKFRWYLYDMDSTFAVKSHSPEESKNSAISTGYGDLIDENFPFRNFFYNSTFQENYLNRYANLLNTTLSTESVMTEINDLIDEIYSEMPRHINHWKDKPAPSGTKFPSSMDDWMDEINLIKTFVEHRANGMRDLTLEQFIENEQEQHLLTINLNSNDSQAGDLKIHDSLILGEQLPFEGLYFPNRAINIEAIPARGYKFVKWEGDIPNSFRNNNRIRVRLNQDYQLTAIFEKKTLF
ncbi:MAG: Spore coat protein CotH [Microgenomates bacterium 39_7]|nr:MAG: Spore coat protein CotH [Microgenomates bacterium 39_7]